MRARWWLLGVALLMAWASPAAAVKFMSVGKAVKHFMPPGAKIYKQTKHLDAAQKRRIREDYGWEADNEYVFYVGKNEAGEVLAYVLLVPEIFNTCFHRYAVGLEPDGTVIETALVEISCPRAMPINRKSFLKQFKGKQHTDPLTLNEDIDGVTGATLSSETTVLATRKAVSLHNILFGGAKPVHFNAETKRARAAASGLIKKAIETGETLDPAAKKE